MTMRINCLLDWMRYSKTSKRKATMTWRTRSSCLLLEQLGGMLHAVSTELSGGNWRFVQYTQQCTMSMNFWCINLQHEIHYMQINVQVGPRALNFSHDGLTNLFLLTQALPSTLDCSYSCCVQRSLKPPKRNGKLVFKHWLQIHHCVAPI